jgi:hypothetical protein
MLSKVHCVAVLACVAAGGGHSSPVNAEAGRGSHARGRWTAVALGKFTRKEPSGRDGRDEFGNDKQEWVHRSSVCCTVVATSCPSTLPAPVLPLDFVCQAQADRNRTVVAC